MLTDLVKGRTALEVAAMPKEELLDELGIPLTPVRLKCAILGLGVLKLALHKSKGTPLPEEWGTLGPRPRARVAPAWPRSRSARSTSCRRDGCASCRPARSRSASSTATGELYAIEDRCSHDDGPLAEGDWDPEACVVVCPRHGSRFDLETGIPMTLPAFEAVAIFPVSVRDGNVVVEVGD